MQKKQTRNLKLLGATKPSFFVQEQFLMQNKL